MRMPAPKPAFRSAMIAALPTKTRMKVPNSSARYFCPCAFMSFLEVGPRPHRTQRLLKSLKSASDGVSGVVARVAASELLEVGEPDLDQRPHRVLDAGLARDRERLLVALPRLGGIDTLLEAVVARDEQPLDLRASLVAGWHGARLAQEGRWYHRRRDGALHVV